MKPNTRTQGAWSVISVCAFFILLWSIPPYTNARTEDFSHTLSYGSSTPLVNETKYTLPILFHNDGTPVNAARMVLHFNPELISVDEFRITEALCEPSFVITQSIDNTSGKVLYECGTISPFSGTTTALAHLTIAPKTEAHTTLGFGTTTSVHAHNGFGTDVLDATRTTEIRL